MTDVWIVETGEYEDRHVYCIARTPEAAEAHIKGRYGKPYVVEWEPLVVEGDEARLVGHFECTQRYSIKHTSEWEMELTEVVE